MSFFVRYGSWIWIGFAVFELFGAAERTVILGCLIMSALSEIIKTQEEQSA